MCGLFTFFCVNYCLVLLVASVQVHSQAMILLFDCIISLLLRIRHCTNIDGQSREEGSTHVEFLWHGKDPILFTEAQLFFFTYYADDAF